MNCCLVLFAQVDSDDEPLSNENEVVPRICCATDEHTSAGTTSLNASVVAAKTAASSQNTATRSLQKKVRFDSECNETAVYDRFDNSMSVADCKRAEQEEHDGKGKQANNREHTKNSILRNSGESTPVDHDAPLLSAEASMRRPKRIVDMPCSIFTGVVAERNVDKLNVAFHDRCSTDEKPKSLFNQRKHIATS